MARMTSRPRIGALIRAGMERKLMDQIQLAAALDVSRSAVNAWINDRAWPTNRIAALEDLLDIKIPAGDEEEIRELADRLGLTPEQRDDWINVYRRRRPAPDAREHVS